MRQIITAILVIILIVSAISFGFTFTQVEREKQRLTLDLQARISILADSLKQSMEPYAEGDQNTRLQRLVTQASESERLSGIAVFDNKEVIIASSSSLQATQSAQTIAANAMDEDKVNAGFVTQDKKQTYIFAIPLRKGDSVIGALTIIQNAGFIDARVEEMWRNTLFRVFLQSLFIALAALFIIRWLIYKPIATIVETIRLTRAGKIQEERTLPNNPLFQPLIREVSNINKSLLEARLIASEEARLRLEKLDSPWTAQRLSEFVKELLKGRTIFLVSNREPYIHTKNGRTISYYVPASGMVTAIEPIMEACGGTWIAHGSGDADKLVVDKNDKVAVPPDEPRYTLKRVWLTKEEEDGYYYGFANEGIWPLCHIAHTRPVFHKEDWEQYKKVNDKFAQVLLSEIKHAQKPLILIQDYHFAMLPRMIKETRPDSQIGIFWHIPWPNAEAFSICPYRKELLHGMLGADLIGFHTQYHCNNFIDTVGRELESLIDFERFAIQREEHITYIKPFPISIAFSNGDIGSEKALASKERKQLLAKLGIHTNFIALGVDRLDYTKGILERLLAFEYFLEANPAYKEHITLIQIAPPSRSEISVYKQFEENVEKEVRRINDRFRTRGWKPIVLLMKHHSHDELNTFYRLADVCLVTSLHDGMNIVAKEFISSRSDQQGVLILSQFAGASRELKEALIVNPYHIEQMAQSIKEALEMPKAEQKRRIKKMRDTLKNNNIYRWSAELLKTLVSLE